MSITPARMSPDTVATMPLGKWNLASRRVSTFGGPVSAVASTRSGSSPVMCRTHEIG